MNFNNDLRIKIAEMVLHFKEGHIPSSYSILDIISTLYGNFLKYDAKNPSWDKRDYFILSKAHGCFALYVVLRKYGFISERDLMETNPELRILGGHPDCSKIPGVEASTGSLGHGISIAAGLALGLKIKQKDNRVLTLIGDGECNEGTIWETALVASNLKLGNFCVIVDNNNSASQVLPVLEMKSKWESFGWAAYEIDGHSEEQLLNILNSLNFKDDTPKIIIANTIKGKGVSFIEGQGTWHHRVPTQEELLQIKKELSAND